MTACIRVLIVASALLATACVDKPVPTFTVTLASGQVTASAGQTAVVTVNAVRASGHTSALTLGLQGPPAGISGAGTIAGSASSGTLSLGVGAQVVAGTYALTLSVSDGGTVLTLPLTLVVTAAAGTAVWTFDPAKAPALLAVQDGAGPWTAIPGSAGTYTFSVAADTGAVAYVFDDGAGASNVVLTCGTKAELATKDLRSVLGDNLTVSGTFAGLADTGSATFDLGLEAGQAFAEGTTATHGTWLMDYVNKGTYDLLGVRFDVNLVPDRLVVHRNLTVSAAGALGAPGAVDFSTEGSALTPHTLTVDGLVPGTADLLRVWQNYQTANGSAMLSGASFYGAVTAPIYHLPAAIPATDDRYSYAVEVGPDDGTGYVDPGNHRTLWTYGTAATDVTVAGPVDMAASSVTAAALAPYARLRLQWAFDATFNKSLYATFAQGSSRTWILNVSKGFAGTALDFTLPDLSALAGWKNAWGLAAGTAVTATVEGNGQNWSTWPAAAGAHTNRAIRTTTVVP